MNKFRIALGATALAVAAVAIVACSKEKTAQQETTTVQQTVAVPNNLTLADMAEAVSWEEDKAFFENQSIKDYTNVCEMVLNDCGFIEKAEGLPYVISWVYRQSNEICDYDMPGSCLVIRKKEGSSMQANAMGYLENGKLVLVPTTEENGFTADGYLVIGAPIEIQYDSITIQEGIYAAYYDENAGKFVAVAVDYY